MTDTTPRLPHALPPRSEMYRALVDRDASYEGVFYLGVRTTGIFCRPTCPARKPRPENVQFFASTREAVAAGYRPCRRCVPMQPEGVAPEWLDGLLRAIEKEPARRWKDDDLRAAGLDPVRVRRWFQRHHSMTFHAYQRARRLGLALGQIRAGDDVMGAAYDHGYESMSGFSEAFAQLFGETPRGSDKDHVVLSRVLTPLGPLVAGASERGLCLLEFADRELLATQVERLRRQLDCVVTPGSNPHIVQIGKELEEYFAGARTEFEVPLEVAGTDFQNRVWRELLRIPYGETRSYEQVARAIGSPKAVRAVGSANGANRMPIVIPCHRVVRADGSLGGYGGELWRKRYLLQLEGRDEFAETQETLDLG